MAKKKIAHKPLSTKPPTKQAKAAALAAAEAADQRRAAQFEAGSPLNVLEGIKGLADQAHEGIHETLDHLAGSLYDSGGACVDPERIAGLWSALDALLVIRDEVDGALRKHGAVHS